jgi:hypothetical protein
VSPWQSGEPNGSGSTSTSEFYAATNYGGNKALWNDFRNNGDLTAAGYVVEYNAHEMTGLDTDSETVVFRTAQAPGQVTDVVGTAGISEVALAWTAPEANGFAIDNYQIEYSTSNTFSPLSTVDTASLSATISGLSNGVTYYFRVKAKNDVGFGAVSSTVSAAPPGTADSYVAFDGSNDYGFYDGAIGSQQNRFTIEAWAYDTATTDGRRGIFRWGLDNRVFLDVVRAGNRNQLFLGINGGSLRIDTDIEFPSNQWVHLAVVREDTAWKLYVDGHLAASGTQATLALSEDLWVGTSFVGEEPNRWSGRIDQVKLWDHSMTAENVATSMNTHAAVGITGGASAPDLLAHYDFNVPNASSVVDITGGKNLALSGSVLTSQFVDVASEAVINGEKIVTFTRSYLNARGGWTVPADASAGDYLVVGGGASGGRGQCSYYWGHGGGGGGVDIGTFTGLSGVKSVTVGVGGLQGTRECETETAAGQGTPGTSSAFNAVTATGGLAGVATQARGGSSGLRTSASTTVRNLGGLGTGSGASCVSGGCGAGGGAGAGGVGTVHDGGPGRTSAISGSNVEYGAGGAGTVEAVRGSSSGGGSASNPNGQTPGSGGADGFGFAGVTWGAGATGIVIVRFELLAVPTISSHPGSTTVQAGSNGTFSVTASPAGATFQWQQSTNGGVVWTNVAGATSATLSLVSLSADMDGNQYRVVVTNTVGGESASVTSNLAILSVEDGVTVTGAFCDGTYTKNGLSVSSGHGTLFYIDTGQGQEIDAGYIAYTVQSATARSDLWVEVTDFTGGVVSLANVDAGTQPLSAITAGGTDTAFFMIKADRATTTAQSHIVNVYSQKPTIGNPKPLYSCGYNFVEVAETIKAAANKVESITSTTVARIGSTMTITVQGDTGTIGQGNDVDGRMIWVTPAARSDWPTDALRLESTSIRFFSDRNRGAQISSHPDTLRVNASSTPALSGTSRQYYTATYTFRVIGSAASIAPIIPIAMISSGTQVKHTDVGSLPTGGTTGVDLRSPTVDLTVTKNVSPTTVVNSNGTTTLSYTVSLRNGGSDVLVIDEVVGTPDSELSYVAGTTQFNSVAMKDPGRSGTASIAFSGPLSLPANSTRSITYDMTVPTCAVGGSYSFDNTATARTGSVVIGSGSATQSAVNIAGNCAEPEAVVTVTDTPINPAVVTGGATTVAGTSATILGTVDPNSRPGLDVRFHYSTNADMSSSTTVVLADTTFSASAYGVSSDLSSLAAGTTYYYVLEVEDPDGGWISGTIKSFTTDPAPSPPAALTLTQTGVTVNAAVLNGSIDANLQAGGVKVVYQWFKDTGTSCTVPDPISSSRFLQSEISEGVTEDALLTGSSAVPMTHPILGLDASARYCFRIVAHYSTNYGVTTAGEWKFFTTGTIVPQRIVWGTSATPLASGGGAGGTTTVVATATNASDGTNSGLAVTYSSVDTSICTVNSSTGVVTSVATSGTCTITATQAGGVSGGVTYAAATPTSISFPISPPVVSPATLLAGTYQTGGYSQPLLATGGTGTYSTWTRSSGTLPPGVTLDAATGLLSGTPTATGVYTFSITTVSNGVTSAPREFTITIAKAAVTVTAASLTVTYGAAAPRISPAYAGFLGSDQTGVDTSPNVAPTCTSTYVVGQNATTTAVTSCSAGSNANYTFTYVTGLITVAKFPVVVTALNVAKQNRVSGGDTIVSADPSLQWTATSPLPAGQTMANVVPGGVSISRAGSGTTPGTIATGSVPAGEADGTFVITPSGTPGTNYTVSYVTGVLTIQKPKEVPALSVTNKTMTYGDVGTASGLISGAATNRDGGPVTIGTPVYTYVDSNGTTQTLTDLGGLPAGSYVVTVSVTPTDGTQYYTAEPVRNTMVLTVERKAITVSAADNKKLVGGLDPVLTWSGAGYLMGDDDSGLGPITISRAAGQTAGSYAITTTGGSTPNYAVSHVSGLFYVYEPVITVRQNQGVLTSRVVAADCRGVKPGATANFILVTAGTSSTIATSIVNADGTCPMTSTLGPAVPQGLHALRIETRDPLNNNIFRTQSIILLTSNIAVANPPGSNSGNSGRGRPPLLTNPNDVTVGPFTFRRPVPAVVPPVRSGDAPAIATPEANRAQGDVTTSLPRLPGMPSAASPAPPGSQGTVDFGNGVQSGGNSTGPATQGQGGGESSAGQGVRTVDQLANERLSGFRPKASTRIEVLGARSGSRFVVTEATQVDSITLMEAITASMPTQAADFFSLDNVFPTVAPTIAPAWLPEQRAAIAEFFAAAGLAAPQSLADLEGQNYTDWVQVSGSAETYVPGSIVYLTVTSEPLVIASAEVARDGRVVLTGSIPVEWLQAGEHRIRLVGIRSLDGVSVDDQGDIQLSAELMDEIQRFDLGTQSTIAVVGENLTGGEHVAMRVVPLVPIAPWWTLWFIALGFAVVAIARWRGAINSRARQVLSGLIVVASSVPGVVIGWLSTVTSVVWWAIGLGLLGAVIQGFLPLRRTSKRASRG